VDSKTSVKLVSLFLVSSVSLLGYVSMSTLGAPTPTAGMVAIDDSTLIYQGNNVNYTFATDAVISRFAVGYNYIELGNVRINSTVSTGYVSSIISKWDDHGSIEWTANTSNPSANVIYSISGLTVFTRYEMLRDSVAIEHFTTDVTGAYSFNYSGPWSPHTFEIRYLAPTIAQQMGLTYAYLIYEILIIGVLVGIVGEAIYPLKHEKITMDLLTQRLIHMAIYIVIALALFDAIYVIMFT